ncbi:hypothetical protein AVEN_175687-1 [Araneus ventricosus]|uniref:Uncharacterized protein n=1 Tax=Araneus ventricosus TaxID=182803 RepID=A0A4Y2EYE3_ARAVE|nr:hypothetical protein AVEN_175687-1 [Araneus ventricosus]
MSRSGLKSINLIYAIGVAANSSAPLALSQRVESAWAGKWTRRSNFKGLVGKGAQWLLIFHAELGTRFGSDNRSCGFGMYVDEVFAAKRDNLMVISVWF